MSDLICRILKKTLDSHFRGNDIITHLARRVIPAGIQYANTKAIVQEKDEKDETIECKNPCPTPESLYNLCDLEKTYQIINPLRSEGGLGIGNSEFYHSSPITSSR